MTAMAEKGEVTILLVDDDPDFLKATGLILKAAGYRVEMALNGAEGLALAESLEPDLIILDVMMPGKDGYSVCRQLKESSVTCDTPVLISTSLGSPEGKGYLARMARYHRADDYIEKPYSRDDLVARVEKLLASGAGEIHPEGGRSILIVDDDVDFADATERILRSAGYEVFVANSGIEALKLAEAFVPDLILMDVMLPDQDGFSVTWELRRNTVTHRIPVIVLTAVGKEFSDPEYARDMAREHRADDYLDKPVAPEVLLERIETALSG